MRSPLSRHTRAGCPHPCSPPPPPRGACAATPRNATRA
jgi:hypothetical protein